MGKCISVLSLVLVAIMSFTANAKMNAPICLVPANGSTESADERLYSEGVREDNAHEYSQVLYLISLMSDEFAGQRKVVALKAAAQLGICGMDAASFVEALANDNGATRVFPFLVSQFTHSSSERIGACKAAEANLASIGPADQRTEDENLLMVFISFAKIGNILNLYPDQDQDGFADYGADVCSRNRLSRPTSPIGTGNFAEVDLRDVGTGISHLVQSLSLIKNSATELKILEAADFSG